MVDDALDGERATPGFRFGEIHGSQDHFHVLEVKDVLPAEILYCLDVNPVDILYPVWELTVRFSLF